MQRLPDGTVTFLFTDVEGSTRLLQDLGERYAEVLDEHRRALRHAFERHGGVEVDTQGDAFFVAFAKASEALAAAREGRDSLETGPIRVRMGLHTGEPLVTDEGYVGLDVHRAARIAAAGHGGQILLSQSTRDLAGTDSLRDLGEHRLKDLTAPERIYQLGQGEFPPLRSLNQSNLPTQSTPLIGRERELAEVLELLRSSRLLTLTGAGGSGKTRLALQVAAELVDDFQDGVWFVPLSALTDSELVLPTIAASVGAKEDVIEFLRKKRLMLVLDNLEQLLPEMAPTIADLLAAPSLRILATSRERLFLSAEQEYAVPTLPQKEAVELFTARARQLNVSFEPDRYVSEIARQLGGLPLAIELAAARAKVLTPRQIAERLGHSLDLLTSSARDVPERQRTLRATIEWSYRLLGEKELRLFTRLAVFVGSFDLEAAETVCDANVDTLQSLVDKSLVRRSAAGRFFLLDTIREYALERFRGSDEMEDLRQRHASFFVALAEAAKSELMGPEQGGWFARLDRDLDNLRAALEWSYETRAYELGLGLAGALKQFWWVRGHTLEGSRYLESLIEAAASTSPRRLSALGTAAILAVIRGDIGQARAFATEAVAVSREAEDEAPLVGALMDLAAVEMAGGNQRQAAELFEEARALAVRVGDTQAVGRATHNLANLALAAHDFLRAAALSEESLGLARMLGHSEGVAGSLEVLGIASLELGDHARATECLRASLALCEELGFEVGAAYAVGALGAAAIRRNQHREGVKLIAASEAFLAEAGVKLEGAERELNEGAIEAARASLDPHEFSAAWMEGGETDLEAAAQAAVGPRLTPDAADA